MNSTTAAAIAMVKSKVAAKERARMHLTGDSLSVELESLLKSLEIDFHETPMRALHAILCEYIGSSVDISDKGWIDVRPVVAFIDAVDELGIGEYDMMNG